MNLRARFRCHLALHVRKCLSVPITIPETRLSISKLFQVYIKDEVSLRITLYVTLT